MLNIANSDSHGHEPTPQFATDAEVAFAQWLRRQLEQRYLGQSSTTLEVGSPLSDVH
jgi:hypothetical protein